MEFEVKKQRICRICMQDDILLDWNGELFEYCGMSFKDCYYKYSHLAVIDPDPYPEYVCEACSLDLQNFHLFMEKAIETQKFLEQDLQSKEDEVKPQTECIYLQDNCGESEDVDPVASGMAKKVHETEINSSRGRGARKKLSKKSTADKIESDEDSKFEDYTGSDEDMYVPPPKRSKRNISKNKTEKKIQNMPAAKSTRNRSKPEADKKNVPQVRKRIRGEINVNIKKKTPVECSYCSKVIHNAYYLKKHEQTHKEDRERIMVCSVCGLKTFTSVGLYNHMKIHQKNRKKEYKCEFCDKAFFNRGGCNIHRRIHLGQMVKCHLCPKEYYRQIDLDRHMHSHSSDSPQAHKSRGSKLKYMVHCKECNKQVSSSNFNAHRAAHMNNPQMRCTACEKDFFCRVSCTRHMRRVHKRAKDGYDDIVMYYEKNRPRLSHVLLEQQQEVLMDH